MISEGVKAVSVKKSHLHSGQASAVNSVRADLPRSLDYPFQVRFAALITVLALAEKLRENYIVLLPESIPFLAELMEGKSGANTDTKSCGHRLEC